MFFLRGIFFWSSVPKTASALVLGLSVPHPKLLEAPLAIVSHAYEFHDSLIRIYLWHE